MIFCPGNVAARLDSEARKHELGETIGLLQMRIARKNEAVDAERRIFAQARLDLRRIADQRGSRAAARQSDAGPEIGPTEIRARAPSALAQFEHSPLADRIHLREDFLRASAIALSSNRLMRLSAAAQASSSRLAHDHMEPHPEARRASERGRATPHIRDLLGDCGGRFSPCQISVDCARGEIMRWLRGAAEIERGPRALHRWKEELALRYVEMRAVKIDALIRMAPAKKRLPCAHEFGRDVVAGRMIQKQAVAGELARIASGDEIDQQSPP